MAKSIASYTDLQTLSQLFATTYNADPNIRKAVELQIRKVNVLSFIFIFNICRGISAPNYSSGDAVNSPFAVIDRMKGNEELNA